MVSAVLIRRRGPPATQLLHRVRVHVDHPGSSGRPAEDRALQRAPGPLTAIGIVDEAAQDPRVLRRVVSLDEYAGHAIADSRRQAADGSRNDWCSACL